MAEDREALTLNSAVERLKSIRAPQETQETPEEHGEEQPPESIEPETLPETDEAEPVEQTDEVEEVEDVAQADAPQDAAETIDLDAEQIAQLLGIEEDRIVVNDEGQIRFRTKVDGEESDATLNDALERYQKESHLTNKGKELQRLEQERQKAVEALNQKTNEFAQQAATLLEAIKDKYVNPLSEAQLKELEEDDPARYAATMANISQRQREFESLVNSAVSQVSGAQNTVNEETNQQHKAFIQKQWESLTTEKSPHYIPDFQKVQDDIASHVKSVGFNDAELPMFVDARLANIAYKAMLYDKGKEGVKTKLTKKIPRVSKPGAKKSKADMSIEAVSKQRKKLKETGNYRDAIELFKMRRK